MDKSIPIKELLSGIPTKHLFWYFVLAAVLTLIIRLILSYFKALAINNGEIDDSNKCKTEETKWKGQGIKKAFKHSFRSNTNDIRIDDCWLPAIIGISELLIFSILMFKGQWVPIAAWIAIKTASSWGGWQKTRTAYNRFLLGNILSLSCSGLISWLVF